MEIKIGLWQKKSKSGSIYYQGKSEILDRPCRVVLFPNATKFSEKSPDMNLQIEFTDERPEEENKTTAIQSIKQDEIIINDDDLPF